MAVALRMVHDKDPKREILDEVAGSFEEMQPLAARVLVAVYKRPEKLKSGLLIPENKGPRLEDEYQGKVGLILKMGPLAFTENETGTRFGGVRPQVGDWIMYRVGDTFPFELGGRRCRMIEDADFMMILPEPDAVW